MASENEQDSTSSSPQEHAVPAASASPVSEAPGTVGDKQEQQPSFFYIQEQEDDVHLPHVDEQQRHEQERLSTPFVLPFQSSAAMATLREAEATGAQSAKGPSPSSSRKGQRRSFPLVKMGLLLGVALLTVLGASLIVFAQPATPQAQTTQSPQGDPVARTPSPSRPTPKVTASPPAAPPTASPNQGQGTPGTNVPPANDIPSAQVLEQLGWTQAGLSLGDAIEALRTGTTFTDREMSYDYRNIGTPTNHSGTLTGSTFLLTPGGQVRFANNDVRVINNVLYEKIRTGKIIQQVVNAHATLVQFQAVSVQGKQRQFAWVNVSFTLLQSTIDPASGKRTERLDQDPASGQPRLHHMAVLLVRVPLQDQGANAPMGGTGWLVNTYALDAQGLPVIATDPSV